MTEAELIQTAQAAWSNNITSMGLFITVLSAYLIAAYAVGSDLTRSQVTLINTLFGVFAGYGLMAVHGFTAVAGELAGLSLQMSELRTLGNYGASWIPMGSVALLGAMIVACYKFMWDVRHPKE